LRKDSRRVLVGALRARCSDIQEIAIEAQRAVCVIDDGQAHFPAHAVLAYSEATKQQNFWERNQRSAVRAELARVFGLPPGPSSLQDCWNY
jgi:transposase